MPRSPPPRRPTATQTTAEAATSATPVTPAAALPLPHERDEAAGHVASAPDPVIVQAKKDLDAGQVDTDMRATPGLDAARRQQLVPGQALVGPGPQRKAPVTDRRPQGRRRP